MYNVKIPCGRDKGTWVSALSQKQLLGSVNFFKQFKTTHGYHKVYRAIKARLSGQTLSKAKPFKPKHKEYLHKAAYLQTGQGSARRGMLQRMYKRR